MSSSPQSSTPISNFKSILDAALSEYKVKTGKELLDHPLATEVQSCDTVDAVLAILQDQVKAFQQSKDGDQRLIERIGPLTQVLFALSATLGVDAVGLTFPPGKGITAGIAVLLSAAKDVRASYDALVELFAQIEIFLKPLGSYTRISSTTEMVEVFVKITAEVLSILSIATREVTSWRAKIYFRNLLGRTDIEDVLKKLDSLIQELIQMAKSEVVKATSEFKSDIKKVSFDVPSDIMWKTGLEVRKWFKFSPPDPSTNHDSACEIYHNVLSAWFFGNDLFKNWMSNGFVLWIHGKSGSGKTILCSSIIQHIMNLRNAGMATLAYYYFDFRNKEKQNVRNFITSLLFQLSEFSKPHFDIIYRLYLSYENGTRQPSNHVLMACLKEMLMEAPEQPVFVIIDSLDECSDTPGFPSSREAIFDVVKELTHHPRHLNLRFCVSSLPEDDLQTKLEPLFVNAVSLHGQNGRKGDISNYVESVVSLDENLKKLREEDKKLVIETLSERADGMFQWVFCQLETLRRSVQQDVRGVLEKLPKTLDETYERMLEDITENNREHARRLFHCLAVAVRPLRVEELAEILSFDFDEAPGGIPTFRRSENQIEAVLSACSSLIAIVNDGDSRVVQFSHLSVKEFLTSNHLASSSGDLSRFHILPKAAHTIVAQVCLGSLLRLEDHVDDDSESSKSFPLAKYAAQQWVTHAQFEDVASSVEDGILSLFDPDKPHFSAWVRAYDMDRQPDGTSQSEIPNPLYYAALCGFHDLVKHLAGKHPQHVNAIGGFYESPLIAALCRKYLQVAGVLLEHGGTVDVRGRAGETVLHKVIRLNEENIRVDTVRFLLERGVDVNAQREDLSTPLHLAIVVGELDIARTLLEHNADVNSQNDKGLAPLHLLTRQEISILEDNDSDLAELLLKSGANVNLQGKDNSTPLHLASYNQRYDIVRVLLDNGANVDAENDKGRTPLQEFFRGERPSHDHGADVARILVERGAEAYGREKYHVTASDLAVCFEKRFFLSLFVYNAAFGPEVDLQDRTAIRQWLKDCAADGNVRDKYETILLHSASFYGKLEMAQVLLDNNVNVNVKNHRGETALHVLPQGKNNSQEGVRMAQLLLERGADVNAENEDHRTPLHAACCGRPEIVQFLLDHGANANAEDVFLRKPLHQVSFGEYESEESGARVAQLLLEHGLDVNASDKYLWTPLHFASYSPRPKIVQVLLDHGAKVDRKNDQGETPLHLVSRVKYDPQDIHVAQLLLDRGADANAKRNDHCTPLHGVAFSGRVDIVRILLDHGAKTDAEDSFLRTPLHRVSVGYYQSPEDGVRTARLLLERGVDMNARDKNRETPLHLASSNERVEIVRVLLEHATVKTDQDPSHLGVEVRGVDVNAYRSDHWTPLHLASFLGSPDIAQLLLDHGARVDAVDNLFRTSLHHVSGGPHKSQEDGVRIAQLLLESGANVNAKDMDCETPLHFASFFGRLEIARMFLKHATVKNDGARDSSQLRSEERVVDVNTRRNDRWTPLHLAAHCGRLEMAQLLLDHGASVNAEDKLLRTPLHHVTGGQYAVEEDGVRVSRLLIERGADVNAQDIRWETPLHLASSSGRLGLVRLLLARAAVRTGGGQNPSQLGSEERSVEVDARKTDDWTPLHLASYFGRTEVARALLDHGASANAKNDAGETPLYVVSRGVYQSQDDGVCIARLLLERGGNVNAICKDRWTALHAASYFGKPEIVRTLLDQGANANAKESQGKNSLDLVSRGEYGSEEDGVQIAQFLLERGVDVNASDKDHWTPLHSASYYGRPEIVRTLLDHGAEVNAVNSEREPPLNMVSRGKYPSQADGVRIAQLLLDRGAAVDGQPTGDWTPLNWASYYGKPDLARVLVDHGATVNKKNNFLRTPLHDVLRGEYESQEDGARVARILLEGGADIKAEDKNGDTPLHFASSFGRIEVARVLFDHGAIANVERYDGETPLHVISRGTSDSLDATRLVQLLTERGVDVNALDKHRETPLHIACFFVRLNIARELLDQGATTTAKNRLGETPLHVLSGSQFKSQDGGHLARLLLERGADANAPDMDGDTPLHSACSNGKLDIARQLLTHGAAADVKNMQGETPLHVVSIDGVQVARLLLEHGVDVNIHDKNHRTPLAAASFHGNLEISRALLDHGATVNAKDDFGWTPLHLSSQFQGNPEERGLGVARLLLERGADAHVPDINHVTPLDFASRRRWSKMVQVLLEHETEVKLA